MWRPQQDCWGKLVTNAVTSAQVGQGSLARTWQAMSAIIAIAPFHFIGWLRKMDQSAVL